MLVKLGHAPDKPPPCLLPAVSLARDSVLPADSVPVGGGLWDSADSGGPSCHREAWQQPFLHCRVNSGRVFPILESMAVTPGASMPPALCKIYAQEDPFPTLSRHQCVVTVPSKPKDSRIAKCGCFLCHFPGRSLLPRSEVTKTLLQLFTSREGQPWTVVAPFSPALVRMIQGQRWWRNMGIIFKVKAWPAALFVTLDGSHTPKADRPRELPQWFLLFACPRGSLVLGCRSRDPLTKANKHTQKSKTSY